MSSVQEIERAIGTLSPREQEELFVWMDDRYAQAVDARLAEAVAAGTVDDRIRQALADHKAGSTREL
jgi:hypothetical protein